MKTTRQVRRSTARAVVERTMKLRTVPIAPNSQVIVKHLNGNVIGSVDLKDGATLEILTQA